MLGQKHAPTRTSRGQHMKNFKRTGLGVLLLLMLSAGCAAPYLHRDAILGLSTAELADSRIDQDALMMTVRIPLSHPDNASASEESFLPEKPGKQRATKDF